MVIYLKNLEKANPKKRLWGLFLGCSSGVLEINYWKESWI
jgi:hypothetical protein